MVIWLVVSTPLKHMKASWHDYSLIYGKTKTCSKPPTSYPLVICYIAIENHHRNSVDFPIKNGWIFPVRYVTNITRGYYTRSHGQSWRVNRQKHLAGDDYGPFMARLKTAWWLKPPSNCCFPLEKSRVAHGKLGWLDTFAHAILHPKKTNNDPFS